MTQKKSFKKTWPRQCGFLGLLFAAKKFVGIQITLQVTGCSYNEMYKLHKSETIGINLDLSHQYLELQQLEPI
jgi:hypothetical protein